MVKARVVALVVALGACGEPLDRAAMRDPATCEGCHPDHTREWASSMHAYASEDPIFVAMNRRGQRETGGALGTFCVRCHAPQAVATGATTDGLDLAALPRELRGVGCIACHQIEAVDALHNGALRWNEDGSMRGGLADPESTAAHDSTYSDLVDVRRLRSSDPCGACHDVVVPSAISVEQTYAEWTTSVFSRAPISLSCGGCHMFTREAPAALGGRARAVHDHSLPGIDVAVTPWPGIEAQQALVARDLGAAVSVKLCVKPAAGGVEATVTLDNVQAGHAFPSGVTHARRVWVELAAEQGTTTTESIGAFAPGEVVHRGDDPRVWVLGSRFLGAAGQEVQFPWLAEAMDSELLLPSTTTDPTAPGFYHARTRSWSLAGIPDRVHVVLHVQPVGLDVIDDLIGSGDLDPAVRAAQPVHTLRATATWRVIDGYGCTR